MSEDKLIPSSDPPDLVLRSLVNEIRSSLGHLQGIPTILLSPPGTFGDDINQFLAEKVSGWLKHTHYILGEVDLYLENLSEE